MEMMHSAVKNNFKKDIGDKKIICFGVGQMFTEAVEDLDIYKNIAFLVDNSSEKNGKKFFLNGYEYPIYKPEKLAEMELSGYILLVTSKYYRSIEKQCGEILKQKDICCYLYPELRWSDNLLNRSMERMYQLLRQKGMEKEKAGLFVAERKREIQSKAGYTIIPKLNFIVTEKCSLSCKDCRALIPYVKEPKDVPFEELKEEINIILSAVDEVVDMEPIGGEPFLYPYLAEAIEYLTASEKVDHVVVTTNGTIAPKERLTRALQNEKVFIVISDYGHIDKMAQVVKHFEKNNISFAVEKDMVWFDVGDFEYRGRSKEELVEEYHNCYCQYVLKYIWDKKIWVCPRAPRLSALGVFCDENDYQTLEVEEPAEVTRKKIVDSFYADYAEACNYCNQGDLDIKLIKAGIQTDGRITESEYMLIKREEYERLVKIEGDRKYGE